jgi:hypothetical protein
VNVLDPQLLALAELSETGGLQRRGYTEGSNLWRPVRTKAGLAFYTLTFSSYLVLRAQNGEERTLSYSAAFSDPTVSSDGDALMETRLPDGRLVISLQRWNERRSHPVTAGPVDAFPSFGPRGATFVYARMDDNTVTGCVLRDKDQVDCRPVAIDPLGPRSTALSPDGNLVAYYTGYGANARVRVVPFSGGATRDIGTSPSECPLVWSSPNGISVYDNELRVWRELDATTGSPTGATRPLTRATDRATDSRCPDPPPALLSRGFDLAKAQTLAVDLRAAHAL